MSRAPAPSPAGAPDPWHDHAEVRWARREHALESLLELGCELAVSLDVFQTADLLLFNLMGHFVTSRSALWLMGEEPGAPPVLARCHGFARAAADAANQAAAAALRERFSVSHSALRLDERGDTAGLDLEALRAQGIALVAPLHGGGALVGWVALGPRVNGEPYDEADTRIVEAALGLVGMVFQNARLYNRVLETNRLLRATNEHLTELDRAKSEFLSNVNHELRTPLTVIIGTLDCLAEHPDVPPSMRGMMHGALLRSRELFGMLERLMTFSDSVSGRLAAATAPGDVAELVHAFHAERLPGATVALHPFTCACAPALPAARFDSRHVRLILGELMDNALKFTPPGTAIHLGAKPWRANGEQRVAIELRDDGPGVPPEREEALFSPFEQVDGSTRRAVGGMGMGLALARQLAEDMGGALTAESQPGRGMTFTLLLHAD